MITLLLDFLREYTSHRELLEGKGYEAKGILSYVERQRFTRRERAHALAIANSLIQLYRNHNEGNVRGALLEKIVESQISARYGGAADICANNVFLEIAHDEGEQPHRTSKSIDVVGWDGAVGEGHDCKVNPREWRTKKDWIRELETEVAGRGLAVALVTADSRPNAARKLRDIGLRTRVALLLAAEDLVRSRLPIHS